MQASLIGFEATVASWLQCWHVLCHIEKAMRRNPWRNINANPMNKEESMKQNTLRKLIIIPAAAFLVAAGTTAFAGWGRDYYGSGGPGWQARGGAGYDCPYYGRSDVNEEDWKKMDQEREAFFKDTEPLRQKIYEKEMALRSEFAKSTPDAAVAAKIQKELSDLEGQFDQKLLDHRIKMRELNPNAGRGYMMGRGRGYGHGMDYNRGYMMGGPGYGMGFGRGYMMGGPGYRGGYGPGFCWR